MSQEQHLERLYIRCSIWWAEEDVAVSELCCQTLKGDFIFNVLSLWKQGRLRGESHLQRQVELLAADSSCCTSPPRAESERARMEYLGRKRQSEWVKEVFVHSPTLLERVSSPGPSHKADVETPLAAAQSERVQKLLCMPVRDLLTQISAGSRMRDRCSKQPVEYRPLITAAWVMKLPF